MAAMTDRWFGIGAAIVCAACAPTLDWRETRPPGSAVEALFPCKPASHARRLELAGASVEMTLYACEAGGATYALAFTDLKDPTRVTVALKALAHAAQANVGASAPRMTAPAQVPGMTPNAQALRAQIDGRAPDGRPVTQHVAWFAYGTQAMQATVLAERPDGAAVATFFDALRIRP